MQAVVTWFGPTDFLKMDEYLIERGLPPPPGQEHSAANSPESLLLGQKITEIPERVKAANPETYITPDAPPFFIQHGVQDPVVPVQMSIHLAAKLEQAIGKDKVRLELLEGAGHGDPQFETPENVDKGAGLARSTPEGRGVCLKPWRAYQRCAIRCMRIVKLIAEEVSR